MKKKLQDEFALLQKAVNLLFAHAKHFGCLAVAQALHVDQPERLPVLRLDAVQTAVQGKPPLLIQKLGLGLLRGGWFFR